jgi:hypothetical protein
VFPKKNQNTHISWHFFFQNACRSWRKNFKLWPPTTLQKLAQSLCACRHHHNGPYFEGLPKKTRGVSHCDLAIYIKKYLKAKEGLWKLKYFTTQKYNLSKIVLQDIITLKLISKFQQEPDIIFQKSSYKNRPIIIT